MSVFHSAKFAVMAGPSLQNKKSLRFYRKSAAFWVRKHPLGAWRDVYKWIATPPSLPSSVYRLETMKQPKQPFTVFNT